jgi:hypothetical protein
VLAGYGVRADDITHYPVYMVGGGHFTNALGGRLGSSCHNRRLRSLSDSGTPCRKAPCIGIIAQLHGAEAFGL